MHPGSVRQKIGYFSSFFSRILIYGIAAVGLFSALIIGALCLRTKGMHFIITLAFAQMIYSFFVSLEKYGGDDGLSLYSRSTMPGLDLSKNPDSSKGFW